MGCADSKPLGLPSGSASNMSDPPFMSQEEFARLALEIVANSYGDKFNFELDAENFCILFRNKENPDNVGKMYLQNRFQCMQTYGSDIDMDKVREIINDSTDGLTFYSQPAMTVGQKDLGQLFPMVKTPQWFASYQETMASHGCRETIFQLPVDDAEVVSMTLALNYGKFRRYVTQEEVAEWRKAFDLDPVKEAKKNLKARFSSDGAVKKEWENPAASGVVWRAQLPDELSASLIVLPENINKFKVKGDPVAIFPVASVLYVTGSKDEEGLRVMVDLALEYLNYPHFLTLQPLRLTPKMELSGKSWLWSVFESSVVMDKLRARNYESTLSAEKAAPSQRRPLSIGSSGGVSVGVSVQDLLQEDEKMEEESGSMVMDASAVASVDMDHEPPSMNGYESWVVTDVSGQQAQAWTADFSTSPVAAVSSALEADLLPPPPPDVPPPPLTPPPHPQPAPVCDGEILPKDIEAELVEAAMEEQENLFEGAVDENVMFLGIRTLEVDSSQIPMEAEIKETVMEEKREPVMTGNVDVKEVVQGKTCKVQEVEFEALTRTSNVTVTEIDSKISEITQMVADNNESKLTKVKDQVSTSVQNTKNTKKEVREDAQVSTAKSDKIVGEIHQDKVQPKIDQVVEVKAATVMAAAVEEYTIPEPTKIMVDQSASLPLGKTNECQLAPAVAAGKVAEVQEQETQKMVASSQLENNATNVYEDIAIDTEAVSLDVKKSEENSLHDLISHDTDIKRKKSNQMNLEKRERKKSEKSKDDPSEKDLAKIDARAKEKRERKKSVSDNEKGNELKKEKKKERKSKTENKEIVIDASPVDEKLPVEKESSIDIPESQVNSEPEIIANKEIVIDVSPVDEKLPVKKESSIDIPESQVHSKPEIMANKQIVLEASPVDEKLPVEKESSIDIPVSQVNSKPEIIEKCPKEFGLSHENIWFEAHKYENAYMESVKQSMDIKPLEVDTSTVTECVKKPALEENVSKEEILNEPEIPNKQEKNVINPFYVKDQPLTTEPKEQGSTMYNDPYLGLSQENIWFEKTKYDDALVLQQLSLAKLEKESVIGEKFIEDIKEKEKDVLKSNETIDNIVILEAIQPLEEKNIPLLTPSDQKIHMEASKPDVGMKTVQDLGLSLENIWFDQPKYDDALVQQQLHLSELKGVDSAMTEKFVEDFKEKEKDALATTEAFDNQTLTPKSMVKADLNLTQNLEPQLETPKEMEMKIDDVVQDKSNVIPVKSTDQEVGAVKMEKVSRLKEELSMVSVCVAQAMTDESPYEAEVNIKNDAVAEISNMDSENRSPAEINEVDRATEPLPTEKLPPLTPPSQDLKQVPKAQQHILNRKLPLPQFLPLTPEEMENIKKHEKLQTCNNIGHQLKGEFDRATDHAATIKSKIDESNESAENLLSQIKSRKKNPDISSAVAAPVSDTLENVSQKVDLAEDKVVETETDSKSKGKDLKTKENRVRKKSEKRISESDKTNLKERKVGKEKWQEKNSELDAGGPVSDNQENTCEQVDSKEGEAADAVSKNNDKDSKTKENRVRKKSEKRISESEKTNTKEKKSEQDKKRKKDKSERKKSESNNDESQKTVEELSDEVSTTSKVANSMAATPALATTLQTENKEIAQEDIDAFDFFTAVPIGSAAVEAEKLDLIKVEVPDAVTATCGVIGSSEIVQENPLADKIAEPLKHQPVDEDNTFVSPSSLSVNLDINHVQETESQLQIHSDGADSHFQLYKDVQETSFEVIPKDVQCQLVTATPGEEEVEFSEEFLSQPLSKSFKKKTISKSEGQFLDDFQGISRPPSLLEFEENDSNALTPTSKKSTIMKSSGSVLETFDETEEQSLETSVSSSQLEKKKRYGKSARRHTGDLNMARNKLTMIEFDDIDNDEEDDEDDDDEIPGESQDVEEHSEIKSVENIIKIDSAMTDVFITQEILPPAPNEEKASFSFAQIAKGTRLRKRSESLCSVDMDASADMQTSIVSLEEHNECTIQAVASEVDVTTKEEMLSMKEEFPANEDELVPVKDEKQFITEKEAAVKTEQVVVEKVEMKKETQTTTEELQVIDEAINVNIPMNEEPVTMTEEFSMSKSNLEGEQQQESDNTTEMIKKEQTTSKEDQRIDETDVMSLLNQADAAHSKDCTDRSNVKVDRETETEKCEVEQIKFSQDDDGHNHEHYDEMFEDGEEELEQVNNEPVENIIKIDSGMTDVFITKEILPPAPDEDKESYSFAEIAKGSRLRRRSESLCSLDMDVSANMQTSIVSLEEQAENIEQADAFDDEVNMKEELLTTTEKLVTIEQESTLFVEDQTTMQVITEKEEVEQIHSSCIIVQSEDKENDSGNKFDELVSKESNQAFNDMTIQSSVQDVPSGELLKQETNAITDTKNPTDEVLTVDSQYEKEPMVVSVESNEECAPDKSERQVEKEHILSRPLPIPIQPELTPDEIANIKKHKKVTAVKNVSHQLEGEFLRANEHARTIKSQVEESNASAENLLTQVKSRKEEKEKTQMNEENKAEKKKKRKRKSEEVTTPTQTPTMTPTPKQSVVEDIDPWKDGPIVLDKKHLQLMGISSSAWDMMQKLYDDGHDEMTHDTSSRSLHLDTTFICFSCGLDAVATKSKLMKCKRCMIASYCSKECQKSNWLKHKKICKCVGKRRERGENEPLVVLL